MCRSKQNKIEFRETEPLVDESPSQEDVEHFTSKRSHPLQDRFLSRTWVCKMVFAVFMFVVGVLVGGNVDFKWSSIPFSTSSSNSIETPETVALPPSAAPVGAPPTAAKPKPVDTTVTSVPSPSAPPKNTAPAPSIPPKNTASSPRSPPKKAPTQPIAANKTPTSPPTTNRVRGSSPPTPQSFNLKGSAARTSENHDIAGHQEELLVESSLESDDENYSDDDVFLDHDVKKSTQIQKPTKKSNKNPKKGNQTNRGNNNGSNSMSIKGLDVPGAVYGYNDVDWSDCIFKGPTCNHYSNYSPIVLRHHRLIFFHCPKNGSTEWLKLFRRMMGYKDWATLSPHDPYQNGLSRLDQYPRHVQLMMMTSPKWTRAMFVRDPLERVLSAYLNKGLSSERYLKKKCCLIFPRGTDDEREKELELLQRENPSCVPLAPYEQQPTLDNFPFETFVNEFMEPCSDIHWRPQSERIHYKNWKFLNFIGHFDNLHEDMVELLSKVKAIQYAETGWGENGDLGLFERERSEAEGPVTHSHDRLNEFYTPELKKKVLKYVKQDYINQWMNLTKPEGFFEAINGDD
jgi:Sulfotransferase family